MRRKPNSAVCECRSHAWAKTTQHGVAIVDTSDKHLLEEYAWHMVCPKRISPYAGSRKAMSATGHRLLHRAVLDLADGKIADHINGNGLDCRRVNLRVCTQKQNTHNRRACRGGTSRYRGVSWRDSEKKWIVQIMVDGKNNWLGRFASEEAAARAYDKLASAAFGEFARLNFPETVSP